MVQALLLLSHKQNPTGTSPMGFCWRSVQDFVLHMCKTLSQLKQNFAAVAVVALAQLSFRCACREKLSFKDSFSLARLTVRDLPLLPHNKTPKG